MSDAKIELSLVHHALEGERLAQELLAIAYEDSKHTEQNYTAAAYWWRKAAEQGSSLAQWSLGNLYTKGKGVRKDPLEAANWYCLAAEQGDASAQNKLGWCYEHGLGRQFDIVIAYALYSITDIFFPSAEITCDALEKKMTPSEIAAAKALAVELRKPKNFVKAMGDYLTRFGAGEHS